MRVGQTRKRDYIEKDVIQALTDIGVACVALSAKGVPDLLCWSVRDGFRLLEVKQPRGRLTPAQVAMRQQVPFTVVRSSHEALALYGVKA